MSEGCANRLEAHTEAEAEAEGAEAEGVGGSSNCESSVREHQRRAVTEAEEEDVVVCSKQ